MRVRTAAAWPSRPSPTQPLGFSRAWVEASRVKRVLAVWAPELVTAGDGRLRLASARKRPASLQAGVGPQGGRRGLVGLQRPLAD